MFKFKAIAVIALLLFLSFSCAVDVPQSNTEHIPEATIRNFERLNPSNLKFANITTSISDLERSGFKNSKNYSDLFKSTGVLNREVLLALLKGFGIERENYDEIFKAFNEKEREYRKQIIDDYQRIVGERIHFQSSTKVVHFETLGSVEAYSKAFSKSICSIVNLGLSVLPISKIAGASVGLLCEAIISAIVMPIFEALKKSAILVDYGVATITIQEHVREFIFELATVQDRFKHKYDATYTRELFWGLFSSNANLEIVGTSIVKAGFDLQKCYKVDFNKRKGHFIISLPKAEILSFETGFEIRDLDNGWLIDVEKSNINHGIDSVNEAIYAKALKSGILSKAEENAEVVIEYLFTPILDNPILPFTIGVKFIDVKE